MHRLSDLFVIVALFLCPHFVCWAQQAPLFRTNIMDYNNQTSHRQNVCDRQDQLRNGTLEFRHALGGLQLRPRALCRSCQYLILSAYTANLASFLVAQNTQVESVQDAVRQGKLLSESLDLAHSLR